MWFLRMLLLLLLLSACGTKGGLYLPKKAPQKPPSAQAASDQTGVPATNGSQP